MSGAHPARTVYRLRNLPAHFDRLSTIELLATVIDNSSVDPGDIQIFSLGTAPNSWKRWQTKVATLMFKTTPSALFASKTHDARTAEAGEWTFKVPGLPEPLVLDTHFSGLTVLNEVNVSFHEYDCIVLSGLASHPFGSWQPKGDDKSFMWIRDALPTIFPGIRFFLHGYNTTLANSKSFQTIVDLAGSLMLELEANGWASPTAKPIIFIAHSLGGVLLKQLLIILADGSKRATFMLSMIKGAIFFGTPSVGMPLTSLLTMVETQPNEDFVKDLSDHSSFLENLEIQFTGISYIGKMRLFWVYETKTSPTVVRTENGIYQRSGPSIVMVNKESATSGRCLTDPASTIQIDEDHSSIVKFSSGDHRIATISSKVRDICWPEGQPGHPDEGLETLEWQGPDDGLETLNDDDPQAASFSEIDETNVWNYKLIIHSLQTAERDSRLGQIDENFGHTFDWAYDDSSVGLTQWLRKGTGIFWISGKPGSGKSTLMKFLLNNPRTEELIHNWKSKSSQIIANFFFHHRGTLLQKSMDGLMRSLLSQLLEREPALWPIIGSMLDAKLKERLHSDRYGAIQSDLRWFLRTSGIEFRKSQYQDHLMVLLLQDPISRFDAIFRDVFPTIEEKEELSIKYAVLTEHKRVYNSIGSHETLDCEIENIWRKISNIDQEKLYKFRQLIKTWYNFLDIETTVRRFLNEYGLYADKTRAFQHDNAYVRDVVKKQSLDKYIKDLAKRHRSRVQAQLEIQMAQWTRSQVDEGVTRIWEQDILDLDVCLFFDALDEYDGAPEVISDFLHDLAKRAPSSKTKARILFSSRPWPVFQKEFKECAGFKLHEYTYEDIREYCTGLLPHDSDTKALMLPLIRDIASGARGVFLWVKLVMRDLIMIAAQDKKADEDLSLKLRLCLQSIPDELHSYYSIIIQRLPAATRIETYVLLECISRSSERLMSDQIPVLIVSGLAQSFQEIEARWKQSWNTSQKELETYLNKISGGLAERKRMEWQVTGKKHHEGLDRGGYEIQLLHQTCKEWVESATFKYIVLGHRANMLWENGHSFFAKCLVNEMIFDDLSMFDDVYRSRLIAHLQEAEKTTGVSQYAYLSQLPPKVYDKIMPESLPRSNQSGLGLATFSGLWLYLKDALNHDERVIQNTTEELFLILFHRGLTIRYDTPIVGRQMASDPEIVEMGKFLLQHGFNLERDPVGVSILMARLWKSPDRPTAQLYIELVIYATKTSLSHEMSIPGALELFSPGNGWHLLHLSPPPVAKWLLQQNVAVNCLNSQGQTPLDYVLDPGSVHQACRFGMDWMYEMLCLLMEHGAILQYYTPVHLDHLITRLADCGYNTSMLASSQLKERTQLQRVSIIDPTVTKQPQKKRDRWMRVFRK